MVTFTGLCNNGQIAEISSSDIEIEFEKIQPIKGYEKPVNNETGKKFPFCCVWHSSVYENTQKWFDNFPNCCESHKRLNTASWFNKANYHDVAAKVVKQLSYTEHCISENINNTDWYKTITDYIEWNINSFGQLPNGFGNPIGLENYIAALKEYIDLSPDKILKEKAERLTKFINSFYNKGKNSNRLPDLNILRETYKKWLKIFPFEISFFANYKQLFESKFPILKDKPEINSYSNIAKAKTISKQELIDVLLNLTNLLLTHINSLTLYEKGLLTEPQKNKLELVLNERKMKLKKGYSNSSKDEGHRYRKILKEWFKDEKEFIEEITPLLNMAQTQQTNEIDKESRIEKIKTGTIIDWWANDECAQFFYSRDNNWYQIARLNNRGEQLTWEVSPFKRSTNNCPIVTKGIIAFIISNFGKNEREIFDKYYTICLNNYKSVEAKKPSSSMRDLDSEFYPIHIDEENARIEFSQKLAPLLSNDEMNHLNQYAQSYLIYIEHVYLSSSKIIRSFPPQQNSDSIQEQVETAFGFMQKTCPRKQKIILNENDYSNLINWITFYYDNNLQIPDIKTPIKNVNTNKTFVQLAFRYFYKEQYPNATFPDSLFEFYKSAFFPYRMDKKSNFYSAKNNDEVKQLMNMY